MFDSWLLDHQDEWKEYDYVGTISWKASQKCHLPDLNTLKKNLQTYNPDIVPFYCITPIEKKNETKLTYFYTF
jgi:hypothetical protein